MGQKSKDQTQRQLGAAIKRCRSERGMSRRDLQEATGRSYPYLSEIEAGKKAPSTEVLGEIAEALGMEMHELLAIAERGPVDQDWIPAAPSHFHMPVAPSAASPAVKAQRLGRMRTALSESPVVGAASVSEPTDAQDDRLKELLSLAEGLQSHDLTMLLNLARRLAH